MICHTNGGTVRDRVCACVCVCVCVIIPLILDVRFVDVPAWATQEEGHKGFLHLHSAVLALIFLARRIQPFLSLVNRRSRILCTNELPGEKSLLDRDNAKSFIGYMSDTRLALPAPPVFRVPEQQLSNGLKGKPQARSRPFSIQAG